MADSFSVDAQHAVKTDAEGVPEGWLGLDIGPASTVAFTEAVMRSKTCVWNGPMGVFEFDNFANGTKVSHAPCDWRTPCPLSLTH